MATQLHGVIHGKRIELERETGLPPGSAVTVYIQLTPLPLGEKRRLADMLCGAWAGDPSLKSIFAEIEQQRATTIPGSSNTSAR